MELSGTTALVTGATRGFGRAITVALHGAGADVVAVARNAEQLGRLQAELGASLAIVAADVADPVVAGSLVERYRPKTLVLNAGAPPLMRPLQHQSPPTPDGTASTSKSSSDGWAPPWARSTSASTLPTSRPQPIKRPAPTF